jgi:hypothetical protein
MSGGADQPWPGPREVANAIVASLALLEPQDGEPGHAAARARILAQAISETFNATILFVAPRLYERWIGQSPDDLLALRDACVALLDKLAAQIPAGVTATPGMPFSLSPPPIRALRQTLAGWDGTLPPSIELRAAAEALLASSGVPEPPGGWAAFDFPTATRH